MNDFVLYSYWRSSAAYRVRIALNFKEIPHEIKTVHLINEGGEHRLEPYTDINPQQLVPSLLHGKRVLTQSLAIIEYLEELVPSPALLPVGSRERGWVRSLAQLIACDIHPLNNLRVMQELKNSAGFSANQVTEWMHLWMDSGFSAMEKMLADSLLTGPYCAGDLVTIADVFLVPQLYNARRFNMDLSHYPILTKIEQNCLQLECFQKAAPEAQADAE